MAAITQIDIIGKIIYQNSSTASVAYPHLSPKNLLDKMIRSNRTDLLIRTIATPVTSLPTVFNFKISLPISIVMKSAATSKKEKHTESKKFFFILFRFMIYKETVNRIMANISFKINDSLNSDVPINDTADTNNIQIGTTIFLFDTLDLVNVS